MLKRILTVFIPVLIAASIVAPHSSWAAERVATSVGGDVRQGPRLLKPSEHGVGRLAGDVAIRDLAGTEHRLSKCGDAKFTVVAMTSTSCPLSKKYLPTLAALAKKFGSRGVRFIAVNTTATDERADMQAAASALPAGAIYVVDPQEELAAAIGAQTTTDVVVLDAGRTVVYHGAIDDQYGFGYSIDEPRRTYLADALESLLAGEAPTIAATDSPGCALASADADRPAHAVSAVTYHNRISRIVERNCVECHRDGGAGPFALTSLDDLIAHAPMIRQVVERGTMPPWFAAEANDHGLWSNDRSLTADDKRDLLAWLASDRPLGDPADAPLARAFTSGWTIGKPDAVFEFAEPVSIKATGTMPYKNVVVETKLAEDKWVRAIEIRPGNREVVHHVLAFVHDADDPMAAADDQQEGRSGYWAIYVPGNSSVVYPEGFAKRLPKGAVLRFQMHYTPNGKTTEDRTQIGVVYADKPPRHEVRVAGVVNTRISIPPGESNHKETAQLRLPFDVEVLALLPHMHLRGKACRYDVATQAGERTLLDIPRYDFNWQLDYRYAEPLKLARGDLLKFTAWYDNSTGNPANPDPTKTVRWGAQTFDEMHLGYVEYIVPGATPDEATAHAEKSSLPGLAAVAARKLFEFYDVDDDGGISREELRTALGKAPRIQDKPQLLEAAFRRGDTDGDGKLDRAEFDRLRDAIRRVR